MPPAVDLLDVTLVAMFGNCHDLTLMAVDDCLRHARFGDVKLFTDDGRGRDFVQAGPFAANEDQGRQRFWSYEMPKHIETSHILNIQWDSGIVNPGHWTDEFLEYDYVGAPWNWFPVMNVGNGGFSLRSKRMLDFLAEHETEFPSKMPEDVATCREYRARLEVHGFKWPPVALAGKFSFERVAYWPVNEIFGYHGQFNWPYVFTDEQIEERMKVAEPYVTDSQHYREMRIAMGMKNVV